MKADRERQRKAKRFQIATKCIDQAEVTYYLTSHDYDVDTAIAQYQADLEWERAHPVSHRPGHKATAASSRRATAPVPAANARKESLDLWSGGATSSASLPVSTSAFNLFAPIKY